MARVVIWGSLKPHTGGRSEVEIEARNVQELLARLGETYPGLQAQIKRGVSVSIDGLIYREGWLQPLAPDSEVFLLPRMQGG
ncbi:MAG: MoaD/ThiS family protein [Rhodospirillaceae bacterium]|nr:MoaD/ThiS family protein [Rhodospirillaceae bacterium]